VLPKLYPDGTDITTINDLLWFEPEYIAEQLNTKIYVEEIEDWGIDRSI